jgi:hypothetical protein
MFLLLAASFLGQDPRLRVLIVNGRTVGAVLVVLDGHSYVDVETLAKLTNGAITIEPNRIALTIPGSESGGAASTTVIPAPPQSSQELSKDFAKAAIAEVAEMREWRGAVSTMIVYGLAVSGRWADDYHQQVQEGLNQASAAASTDGDRNVLQLLTNESGALVSWAAGVSADRQHLNTSRAVDPNTLQNDPALAKITNCSRFLSAMLVTGSFADDASCH